MKTVADAMTPNPIVASPEMSLKQAIRILAEQRIGGLPVVDTEGKPLGVLSETDLMIREAGVTPPAYISVLDSLIYLEDPARFNRELHKAVGQTVSEVMSKPAITVPTTETLHQAARTMYQRKIHRLPVIDGSGRVVGVLTISDVIRAMVSEMED